MANCFKQYIVTFHDPAERLSGRNLLDNLSGHIDTDSADVKIDDNSVHIRFVTAEADKQIVTICEDAKKRLDMASKTRVFYKITIVSL